MNNKMFQVSTLQALALGYSKGVISVLELMKHGVTGLGTYENVDGEMIMVDRICYRATDDGSVVVADKDCGVPFCAVAELNFEKKFSIGRIENINELKTFLNNKIEEDFGLNSMHMVNINGEFEKVMARSESAYESHHVELKDVLAKTQKDFYFDNIRGTLVCVYFPDYMDGINAAGWHFHFISEDRTMGGHVFELKLNSGEVVLDKITEIEIKLPSEAAFDTYALREASDDDIKKVEQGE